MQEHIRVLLVDDAEAQYYLIEGYLLQTKTMAFHLDWAASLDAALVLVQQHNYDICLLDYELGPYTGVDVLQHFRQLEVDTPVIILTGYGTHDVDMAVMEAGAVDFIDKTALSARELDRSIRYAIQQARHIEALRQSELRFRAMVEKGSDFIFQLDGQGRVIYTSPSITRILGYTETTLLNKALIDYIHADDLPIIAEMFNTLTTLPENPPIANYRIRCQDGRWLWFESIAANLLKTPGIEAIIVNAHDITERRQLLEAEQEQRAIAEALLDTSNALNSTLDFDDVLLRILENVGNVIPHQSANVMLIDENNRTYLSSARGYEHYPIPFSAEDFVFNIDEVSTLQKMAQTCQPLIVSDVLNSSLWVHSGTQNGIRSYIGVPIIADGEVTGFINLDSPSPHYFSEKHVEYLRLFANQAVIAIRNARAYQQAQDLAALEERQRLARELHDAVSQTLFSASVIADSLTRLIESDPSKLQMGLEKLTQLNRSALAEMRSLLVELRPQAIVSTPLPELLRNLANGLRGRANIDVHLEIMGDLIELKPDVHLQFYRLAQEILNNVHKHAHAQHMHIDLRYLHGGVELAIADDGIGFDLNVIPPDHHGVRIMYERALKADIAITIDTAPDEGTYIHMRWPVKTEENTA